MNKLPEVVTHPELCAAIVEQFAFMKLMSIPEDSNATKLVQLDLNDVLGKADDYFVHFTSFEEAINNSEHQLEKKLTLFLAQWKHITDVTAIQQNVHNKLNSPSSF